METKRALLFRVMWKPLWTSQPIESTCLAIKRVSCNIEKHSLAQVWGCYPGIRDSKMIEMAQHWSAWPRAVLLRLHAASKDHWLYRRKQSPLVSMLYAVRHATARTSAAVYKRTKGTTENGPGPCTCCKTLVSLGQPTSMPFRSFKLVDLPP